MAKAKFWFLLFALIATGVFFAVTTHAPTEEMAAGEATEPVAEEGVEAGTFEERAATGSNPETIPSSEKTSYTPEPTASSQYILFPYDEVISSKEYYVGWSSAVGTHASLVLVRGEEEIASIADCANMPVAPDIVQYCKWLPKMSEDYKGTSEFSLKLIVTNTAGGILKETQSQKISFVSSSALNLVPYENRLFGWEVRYPKTWHITTGASQVIIAQDTNGLLSPLESDEALVVEYCATVYEDCLNRIADFRLVTGTAKDSFGGKSTEAHTRQLGSGYVREDLLMREGIAFFVSRRAANTNGVVFSPFVRESLASFKYIDSRTSVERYSLDESFRAGELLLKYVDSDITYVRIYTGGRNCSSEIDTATFSQSSLHDFRFTKNDCTIDGTQQGNDVFILEEDGCEALHTGTCEFEGTYELIDY